MSDLRTNEPTCKQLQPGKFSMYPRPPCPTAPRLQATQAAQAAHAQATQAAQAAQAAHAAQAAQAVHAAHAAQVAQAQAAQAAQAVQAAQQAQHAAQAAEAQRAAQAAQVAQAAQAAQAAQVQAAQVRGAKGAKEHFQTGCEVGKHLAWKILFRFHPGLYCKYLGGILCNCFEGIFTFNLAITESKWISRSSSQIQSGPFHTVSDLRVIPDTPQNQGIKKTWTRPNKHHPTETERIPRKSFDGRNLSRRSQ